MTVDLWTEASRDVDAEQYELEFSRAKVAVTHLWPFLSLAQSEGEFEQRLAIAASRIAEHSGEHLFEPVMTSLREDFRMTAAAQEPVVPVQPEPSRPLQIFHVASGRWITVQGALEGEMAAAPAQPAVGEPEAGPMTGETGTYPQHPTGADPFSPLNGEYPAQPQEWSGEGKPGWVDNPMNFAPYRQANANPNYFAGGSEGAQGDEQASFPEDVALDEPDYRVDEYGAVPPLQSSGTQGDGHPYSNSGNLGNHEAARGRHPFAERQGFFDPGDVSVRMIATVDSGTSTVGAVPDPPPAMMPDGPGAVAKEPMELTAATNVRQRPSAENPGEVADEYESNTWDGPAKQRPLQPAEHRSINTPQTPQDAIPQQSSSNVESEELRRESARRMTSYLGLNLGWPQRTFTPPMSRLISVGAA